MFMQAVVFVGIFLMGMKATEPTPYNLTDECKPQTVKSQNGNYSYVSYEHCVK